MSPPESSLENQNHVARVGNVAPPFEMTAVDAQLTRRTVRDFDFRGQWLLLLFYPRDFSFVCPTELTSFSSRLDEFQKRNCAILGVSCDPVELHEEWLGTSPEKGGMAALQFPLAADADGDTARRYGIWDDERGVSLRGLFLVDPVGVLQYGVVHNLSVGRSTDEILRVLDALRSGGLCPAGWTAADGTIDVEAILRDGHILGHYRIQKHLGRGNFGSVFAANDLRLRRPVALKVLHRDAPGARQALLAEARAAAKLNHPNVCTIYSVEEEEGLPLIVMEHIQGEPLSRHIARGLDPASALTLATGIARGLAAAHELCLAHSDLKPGNILVSPDQAPKILDFGLARSLKRRDSDKAQTSAPPALEQNSPAPPRQSDQGVAATQSAGASADPEMTKTASHHAGITGTPAYMSPEQAQGETGTPASDVFALGLVLTEMLTGKRVLSGNSVVQVIEALRMQPVADQAARSVTPLGTEVATLIRRMLAPTPAERPTMKVVLNELNRARRARR